MPAYLPAPLLLVGSLSCQLLGPDLALDFRPPLQFRFELSFLRLVSFPLCSASFFCQLALSSCSFLQTEEQMFGPAECRLACISSQNIRGQGSMICTITGRYGCYDSEDLFLVGQNDDTCSVCMVVLQDEIFISGSKNTTTTSFLAFSVKTAYEFVDMAEPS